VQPEASPTVTVRISILPHLALTPSSHIYSCPCRLSYVHSHQTMPMLQPFWAAGFAFSRGHFVLRVPYDPYLPMLFQVPINADGVWERQHMTTRPSPALPPTTHHLSFDSLRRTGGGNQHGGARLHPRLRLLRPHVRVLTPPPFCCLCPLF
jgi:hypothetical protein